MSTKETKRNTTTKKPVRVIPVMPLSPNGENAPRVWFGHAQAALREIENGEEKTSLRLILAACSVVYSVNRKVESSIGGGSSHTMGVLRREQIAAGAAAVAVLRGLEPVLTDSINETAAALLAGEDAFKAARRVCVVQYRPMVPDTDAAFLNYAKCKWLMESPTACYIDGVKVDARHVHIAIAKTCSPMVAQRIRGRAAGLTFEEIARGEGVTPEVVQISIERAAVRIAKYMKGECKR